MDPAGFEPAAPALQGRCSTGLSYRPNYKNKIWQATFHSSFSLHTLLFLIFIENSENKKEVIHPQVPLRIPCDDLTHLTELKFGSIKKTDTHLNPARVV